MTRNGNTAQIAFCLLAVIAVAKPAQAVECPVEDLTDDAKIVETCTARLGEANLSNDQRAAILVTRGRALQDSGRNSAAAVDYDQAIALADDPTNARIFRGWLAQSDGDYDTAIENAIAAQARWPNSPRPYALIGAIKRVDDFDGSRDAYRKAIELAPNNGFYHYSLATLLEKFSHNREALAETEVILHLPASELDEPESVFSMNEPASLRAANGVERNKLLSFMGRFDDAEIAINDAVRGAPCALTYAVRADFHLSRDLATYVIQPDIDKALALKPDFWLPHETQAGVDDRAKNTDGALAEYKKASELYPKNGYLHWSRAIVLRNVGRLDEATAEALIGIRIDPDVWMEKSQELGERGYLIPVANGTDPLQALRDAVRACMLDERCL